MDRIKIDRILKQHFIDSYPAGLPEPEYDYDYYYDYDYDYD